MHPSRAGLGRLRLLVLVAAAAAAPRTAGAGDDTDPTPALTPPPRAAEGEAGPPADVAALVADAQSGDAEAFGLLYDRYVDDVYRYVASRTPSRQVAEDLTSEVFLRALRRVDSFSWQGRDFRAWLVTIARNLVLDHYKSARVRREVVLAAAPGDRRAPAAPSAETTVMAALRDETLLRAVAGLPGAQRECVELRFLQGLSVSETALVLGKGEGAVKAVQHRAVRALARRLADEVL